MEESAGLSFLLKTIKIAPKSLNEGTKAWSLH